MADSSDLPALDPSQAVSVGLIVGAHGVQGELRVYSLTDFPERFRRGRKLWLDGFERSVERARWQKQTLLLKLEGIETRDEAEALHGHELMLPAPAAIEEADRYYQHDILGLRVVDAAGRELGSVVDILSTGSNDVYVVGGERGELLLPAIEDVVREIDIAAGHMRVELLPGLDFHQPSTGRGRQAGPARRRPSAGPRPRAS